MKIVFAASEAAPFIKTGGLGDVMGALPAALAGYAGNELLVFLPYHESIKKDPAIVTEQLSVFETQLAWRRCYTGLFRLKSRKRKLQVYFIDNEQYFARECIYGYYDDGERYAFFCRAVLESLKQLGQRPDVIHCNDWQTALIPALLHAFYEESLGGARTVFTIHNIEYQGWADPNFVGEVLGLPDRYLNTFEYNGAFNAVKGAILSCDALTTVSESYAREICLPQFAHGLEAVIGEHAFKITGIVNGIDTQGNDPEADVHLAQSYNAKTSEEGKAACKVALQRELGLPVSHDVPMIGMVSRLVGHKGLDLLCEAMEELMRRDLQLVVLGTGDAAYERALSSMAEAHRDKLSLNLCFNLSLASRIYAASDLYLMPSGSEPCGLSQMIAMRYGSVPIVHETGGLKDTVTPFDTGTGEGLGFPFKEFTVGAMMEAIDRALRVRYENAAAWNRVIANGMTADLSWRNSAGKYMELYRSLTKA